MMSKFPGLDHSCRRRYVAKHLAERRIIIRIIIGKKNKEISRSGLVLPVEYLRNGKRYSSFVFTMAKRKSRATRLCKPRFCSCYRFWDIVVANIKNFKIFHFWLEFARANSYMPSNEFVRHNEGLAILCRRETAEQRIREILCAELPKNKEL